MLSYSRTKSPADILDYTVDFADWLSGDTIVSATVATYPNDLVASQPLIHPSYVTIWLSGGSNRSYKIVTTIVTANGRTYQQGATLQVSSP